MLKEILLLSIIFASFNQYDTATKCTDAKDPPTKHERSLWFGISTDTRFVSPSTSFISKPSNNETDLQTYLLRAQKGIVDVMRSYLDNVKSTADTIKAVSEATKLFGDISVSGSYHSTYVRTCT